MDTVVQFTVPGKPMGKQRPRHTRSGMVYTQKETVNYEQWVRLCYQEQVGNKTFTTYPVLVHIHAYFGVPKSASKKQKELMLRGIVKPTKKPDVDNIIKIVLDGLNGIAYADDKQVAIVSCTKEYDEQERVEVIIKSLE